jgi:hypothetical protein
MDDLVMARLAVLKQRHEKQMLAAASEMDQHASHHWERDDLEGRASERMYREDTHHAEHRLHKLPPEDSGAGVKSAEVEPGAAWREVTSGAKWGPLSLEEVRAEQAKFSVERNWTQFHKPRNIMAAFTAEVGEVNLQQFQLPIVPKSYSFVPLSRDSFIPVVSRRWYTE